jgi:hypothetical protein
MRKRREKAPFLVSKSKNSSQDVPAVTDDAHIV